MYLFRFMAKLSHSYLFVNLYHLIIYSVSIVTVNSLYMTIRCDQLINQIHHQACICMHFCLHHYLSFPLFPAVPLAKVFVGFFCLRTY